MQETEHYKDSSFSTPDLRGGILNVVTVVTHCYVHTRPP